MCSQNFDFFFFFFFFCMLNFINNILLVKNYFNRIQALAGVNNAMYFYKKKTKKTRAVVGQRSSPAGYILYCNIFIIKKIKMK